MGDLVQAVDELVCNVIEHGYGHGTSGPVEVQVTHDRERIVIKIVDQAPPFDPTGHPTPDLSLPWSSGRSAGWACTSRGR